MLEHIIFSPYFGAQDTSKLGEQVGVAAALGPPIGGLLVDTAGWPAIFYVNIALVVPAFFLGRRWLPRVHTSGESSRIDTAGAAMLAIVLHRGCRAADVDRAGS